MKSKRQVNKDLTASLADSYSDGYLSHASIARYGQLRAGDSGEVISAGYISKFDGVFVLNNYSGHYQPPIERLVHPGITLRG